MKIKVVVFDLDNTLYNEIDYLKVTYSQISKDVKRLNICLDDNELSNFLVNTFLTQGREKLFQKFITKFGIKNYDLEKFLNVIRNVQIEPCSIKIKPFLENFIKKNIYNYYFVIATNGNPDQQKNKLKSINIPHLDLFRIIYCNTLGKDKNKPSPTFINQIVYDYHIRKDSVILIGDSKFDKLAAQNGKIHYLNIDDFQYLLKRK